MATWDTKYNMYKGSTNNGQWAFWASVYYLANTQDIVDNSDVVRVDLWLGRENSASGIAATFTGYIEADRENYGGFGTQHVDINLNKWDWTNVGVGPSMLIGTFDFRIKHDQDGNRNVRITSEINTNATPSYMVVDLIHAMPQIPRASGITCSSPNIGDTAIITVDRKSPSFTNTVTYLIGNISGTIATKTGNTVLSLETASLEDKIYELIPNSREAQGTVYCETYNGNTKIGDTQSSTFRLYAKENVCKPTVSAEIVDTNEKAIAITGDSTKLIKYVSKPKVTITASPNKSATIKNYLINLNDGKTSSLQEDVFPTISSNSIIVNAIDSRNYENPQSIDLTDRVIDYINLHIDNINLYRPEGTSNEVIMNLNGVWFNDSFNEENINKLNIKYQYRKTDEVNWSELIEITPTIASNTFKFEEFSLGNIYDYDTEYQFKVIVNDLILTIGNLDMDIITVPKGQEVIAIGEDGGWVYGDWYLNDQLIELLDIYSTEERLIGTWFNKKLYQRTFELGVLDNMTHPNDSGMLYTYFTDAKYNNAIRCELMIVSPDDNNRTITERNSTNSYILTSWAETIDGKLQIVIDRKLAVHYSEWIGYATVRYTKINDYVEENTNTLNEEEENV